MPTVIFVLPVAPDLPAQRAMLFLIPDELASDGIDLQMGVTCLDCVSAVVIDVARIRRIAPAWQDAHSSRPARSATQPMKWRCSRSAGSRGAARR